MADQRPGSYARQIDPEGGIKGPDLTAAFDKAKEPPTPAETSRDTPPLASRQVADSSLTPREPAPPHAYDQAKAAQHRDAMKADDKAVREAALLAKAQLFVRQNAAKKAKGPPSLGKSFGRDMERGDD